ncbi:MAG: winged helix-turn-helix transcriptional regulator [Vulcanimicrobiaceae bacterium]
MSRSRIRAKDNEEPAERLCPRFHRAVELIGRRWSGAIIRVLLAGPCRFNEMLAVVPGISDRLLSERLRELEAEGIVGRTVLQSPVRSVYELTPRGRALEGPLRAIEDWAQEWP